jgi:hypothetical protein
MKIRPGVTKVVEGNVLLDATGNPFVNANAYDGVDNNFNGLIDENYRLHYHQTKVNPIPPHQVLFDILRPLRHVDYLTGAGTSPFSMIDERRDDRVDNNLNWNIKYDDVGIDGLDDGAFGAHDGLPTSGYDVNFHDTGLPGEPHIDKTDVKESDQIGLTNFSYFSPSGVIRGSSPDSSMSRPRSWEVSRRRAKTVTLSTGAGTSPSSRNPRSGSLSRSFTAAAYWEMRASPPTSWIF